MALPGMKSTIDFAADERPKNWREGILWLKPRNNAPLYSLTAVMKSEPTNDPEFKWWEEPLSMHLYKISADTLAAATTIPLTADGLRLKPGDMLKNSRTGEAMRIASIVSNTSITVTRAVGAPATPSGTAANMVAATDTLVYIGSAYREGAPRSVGVSNNPTQRYNVTQIFRDPVEITRTASQTNFRTGDAFKNDKERTMHKHAVGIERAMWFGTRYETQESGQPLRFTGGILDEIPAANVKTVTAGGVDMDELESYFAEMFAFGSSEKVAWASVKTLTLINAIVRKNTQYNWGQGEKEYGMMVKRLFTPAGTLVFTEHPLFSQAGDILAEDVVVMDTDMLKYRYMQDTTYLKDRQQPGDDGKCDEWLTECGLEVHHPKTFFWLKGFKIAAKDN